MYSIEYNADDSKWIVVDNAPSGGVLATFTEEQDAYDFVANLEAEEGREDYLNDVAKALGQTRNPGEDASFTTGF
jgi:hypothetical protein